MNPVLVENLGRVCRIEIVRPDKKNALTLAMYAAIADALAAAEDDAGVRAILIHGRPDCFCSGNDLKDFLERPVHDDDSPAWRFLRTIAAMKKPLVAAVGGPAIGIGTTLLLHCDLVYATPAARFQLPFVPLGLVPEAGSSLLLPQLAGYQRAAELLLLGRPFGAEKAFAAGIVTEIIAEGELLAYGRDAALGLAALPPASLRLTKEL
ncbi:MAG: enoyl-CoA hydratase-related protein, partial [Betaproteobacteria bacterium]|nr:enoyl-CoA hydratase-related protein [Betaproteobacteria bacterium]